MQGRAWAGGEINKSLLTLGRVINAIFEHSGHIPWVVIQSARIKLKMVAANSQQLEISHKTVAVSRSRQELNCLRCRGKI